MLSRSYCVDYCFYYCFSKALNNSWAINPKTIQIMLFNVGCNKFHFCLYWHWIPLHVVFVLTPLIMSLIMTLTTFCWESEVVTQLYVSCDHASKWTPRNQLLKKFNIYLSIYLSIYQYAHTYTFIDICMHVCMCIYTYVNITWIVSVCVCLCVCVCVCVCVCI